MLNNDMLNSQAHDGRVGKVLRGNGGAQSL